MNVSMDRPERAGSIEQALVQAERAIAARLRECVDEITDLWHQELVTHLAIRPQAIFPGDELLDHMPLVVRHVIGLVEGTDEIPQDVLDALHAVTDHWRDAGYGVEESLLHFRILNRVLHEELCALIDADDPALSGGQAARVAESLSHGVTLVQAVLVGNYRDREEERFGNFASMLTHEIRAPLSSALTTVQTLDLLEQQAPEAQREAVRHEALERVERTLWQLQEVVDAVTAVAVPGQQPPVAPARKPLTAVVSAVLEEFRDNGEAVVVEQDGDVPGIVVPHEPILLALHNLVRNAVAYSDPAKPERWVRITCEYDEVTDCWLLRVRDNGVGIPEGERQLIFRRFRRGKSARGKGFGLGLSIVRESARHVSGDVTVESEPGRGSTFTFAFPSSACEG